MFKKISALVLHSNERSDGPQKAALYNTAQSNTNGTNTPTVREGAIKNDVYAQDSGIISINPAKIKKVQNITPAVPWKEIVVRFKQELGEIAYENWIKYLEFVSIEGDTMILSAKSRFIRELVLNNYFKQMREIITEKISKIKKIDIRVGYTQTTTSQDISDLVGSMCKVGSKKVSNLVECNTVHKHDTATNDLMFASPLNPHFTFDHFVYGEANKAAYFSTKQLAELSERDNINNMQMFKSLYLYGSVGMGKTHLLQALANHAKQFFPSLKICYLTAEKFTQHYVRAIKQNMLFDFKTKVSELDILLLDDLQLICGRNSTEKEFFTTFDHLIESSKKVVIACDQPPHQLNLGPRSKSRLSSCLTVAIIPPDFDLRVRVLKYKLDTFYHTASAQITIDMLEFIALNVDASIRELEGILHKIIAYCDLMGMSVSAQILENVINENCSTASMRLVDTTTNMTLIGNKLNKLYTHNSAWVKNTSGRPSTTESNSTPIKNFGKIMSAVAQYYNLDGNDIASKIRSKKLSTARQVVAYLAKEYTLMSYQEIGSALGGRNYSTIIYLVNAIKNSKQSNIAQHISYLRSVLLR
ncbi:Chromosomal replication initiator protein DnaA [Alphaproteobacteria bacterium]